MANNNADTIYALATPLVCPRSLLSAFPAIKRWMFQRYLMSSLRLPAWPGVLFKDRDGNILDDVMLLSFTGPASATGEDAGNSMSRICCGH